MSLRLPDRAKLEAIGKIVEVAVRITRSQQLYHFLDVRGRRHLAPIGLELLEAAAALLTSSARGPA